MSRAAGRPIDQIGMKTSPGLLLDSLRRFLVSFFAEQSEMEGSGREPKCTKLGFALLKLINDDGRKGTSEASKSLYPPPPCLLHSASAIEAFLQPHINFLKTDKFLVIYMLG